MSAGDGRRALVTGASGGIGEAIARELGSQGYQLTLVARSAGRLTALADELGGARTIVADLADPATPAKVVAEVSDVDVLVNNAGIGDYGPFVDADLDKTLGMVQLNITALTDLTHRYLRGMVERGHGRILNVSSTAAFQPGPLMAVYYATKAYVLSFSEAIAEELRGTGVTVTALCPGPTASGFQAAADMELSALVKGRRLPTSEAVARYGVRAMHKGDVVAVHGAANKVLAASIRFSPRPVVRRLVKRLQQTKS
jgi:short-subunit dehydrogenase